MYPRMWRLGRNFIIIILILGIIFTFYVPIGIADDTTTRSRADSDGDGLADEYEVIFLTDQHDPDSDDDGVLDGSEGLNISKSKDHEENDPDHDGWNNAMDADSDGDGILDGTERGITENDINLSATDLTKGRFFPDQDPGTITNPLNTDTDGDTWLDGEEDRNGNGKYEPEHGEMDPTLKDYDNDNLHDDTQDIDDDNDGMSDDFENSYPAALNPLDSSDADNDYDGDGYSNLDEYLGDDGEPNNTDWSDPTDPYSTPIIDSDNDNIPDITDIFPFDPSASKDFDYDGCPDEWNPGKSKSDSTSVPKLDLDIYPGNPGACRDTDGDKMPDSINMDSNNDPLLVEDPDDDNDGLPDWWERMYSLDSLNATDSMEDADSDGFSNLNEYIGNTDPRNSYDYPDFYSEPGQGSDNDDWIGFISFIIIIVFAMMLVAIFIGFYVVKKRKEEEEFWTGTFGDSRELGVELDEESRERYHAWRRRVEAEGMRPRQPRQKYKLEIIGGPDDSEDVLPYPGAPSPSTKRRFDPRFKGRHCVWCDNGITQKFIKRCPEQRPDGRSCPDGPFCSRRCLREHLRTVPHYRRVNF